MAKERAKAKASKRWNVILAERLVFMAGVIAFVTVFVRHRALVDQALRYLIAALR